MGTYVRKTEGIDPERGNCLLLYPEKVDALVDLTDNEFLVAVRSLFLWFIKKTTKDEAMKEIVGKCKNKLLIKLMAMIFDGQTRYATSYIEKCNRKKRRKERNGPCYGFDSAVPAQGEISHLKSPEVVLSDNKVVNWNSNQTKTETNGTDSN